LLAWLFKVTGQNPSGTYEFIKSKIINALVRAKLKPEFQIVEVKSGSLLVVIAQKQ
jgi:hypothetical protein